MGAFKGLSRGVSLIPKYFPKPNDTTLTRNTSMAMANLTRHGLQTVKGTHASRFVAQPNAVVRSTSIRRVKHAAVGSRAEAGGTAVVEEAPSARKSGLALMLDDGTRKSRSVAENTAFVTGFFKGIAERDSFARSVFARNIELFSELEG